MTTDQISDYGLAPDERPWRQLIDALITDRMTAPDFERAFLGLWQEMGDRKQSVPRVIDMWFFMEVDAYCADPALRGPDDLDDAGLKLAAREALARMDGRLSQERH